MAIYIIPTRTDIQHYSERIDLDGTIYLLTLAWNSREEKWYISVADSEDVALVSGIKVVVDVPLFSAVSNADMPPGVIMAMDTSGTGLDPGLYELGDRVLLMYQEEL